MNELKLTQFILPVIVLFIVIACYNYFGNKASKKRVFKKLILTICSLAFLFNVVWEIAQGPLYEGFVYDFGHISLCVLASVADMLMVLLLYFVFSIFYKQPYWVNHMTVPKITSLVFIGGIGAILGELRHVAAESWSYTNAMPTLPFIDVGLSPVLQFMILPTLIFMLAVYLLKKSTGIDLP